MQGSLKHETSDVICPDQLFQHAAEDLASPRFGGKTNCAGHYLPPISKDCPLTTYSKQP